MAIRPIKGQVIFVIQRNALSSSDTTLYIRMPARGGLLLRTAGSGPRCFSGLPASADGWRLPIWIFVIRSSRTSNRALDHHRRNIFHRMLRRHGVFGRCRTDSSLSLGYLRRTSSGSRPSLLPRLIQCGSPSDRRSPRRLYFWNHCRAYC